MDTIVPYRNAVVIKAQADKVGLMNELITVKGAGHVPIAELVRRSLSFSQAILEALLCGESLSCTHVVLCTGGPEQALPGAVRDIHREGYEPDRRAGRVPALAAALGAVHALIMSV